MDQPAEPDRGQARGLAARHALPPRRDDADRGGHRAGGGRDVGRARRPAARPRADRRGHPAADRRRVLQRAAGRAGAAVHHVLRPRHAAEDRAGDDRRVLPAVLQHLRRRVVGGSRPDRAGRADGLDAARDVPEGGGAGLHGVDHRRHQDRAALCAGGRHHRRDAGRAARARLPAQRCGVAVRHDIALCGAVHPDAARACGFRNGRLGRTAHAAVAPCRRGDLAPKISLAGVGKTLRHARPRGGGAAADRSDDPRPRIRRAGRSERLRQVDDPEPDRRTAAAERRRGVV